VGIFGSPGDHRSHHVSMFRPGRWLMRPQAFESLGWCLRCGRIELDTIRWTMQSLGLRNFEPVPQGKVEQFDDSLWKKSHIEKDQFGSIYSPCKAYSNWKLDIFHLKDCLKMHAACQPGFLPPAWKQDLGRFVPRARGIVAHGHWTDHTSRDRIWHRHDVHEWFISFGPYGHLL